MKNRHRFAVVGLLLLLPALMAAGTTGFAIGTTVGTPGPGLALVLSVLRWVNVRVVASYLPVVAFGNMSTLEEHAAVFGQSLPEGDEIQMARDLGVEYDIDLQLLTAIALVDLHPFGAGLHLTAGVVYNANHLYLSVTPTNPYNIGSDTEPIWVPPQGIGGLDGQLFFEKLGLYVGLGLACRRSLCRDLIATSCSRLPWKTWMAKP